MRDDNVLIFMSSLDAHASAVEQVINKLGGTPTLIDTARVPSGESVSLRYSETDLIFRLGNFEGPLGAIRSTWNRRYSRMFALPDRLHPADQTFVRDNTHAVITGVAHLLDTRFPVNSLTASRISSNKLAQLQVAQSSGFRIPRTLISNNYDDISSFLRLNGQTCMKPYYTHSWKTDSGPVQAMTVRIEPGHGMDKEAFENCPHIFQEFVSKNHEYRAVLFGNFVSAVRINSKGLGDKSQIDWRATPEYLSNMEPCVLPDKVVYALRKIMKRLGLRFGAFDLAETAEGEFVFFEVNESGQWVWQELHCPDCVILQPFSEFLMSADDLYRWNPANLIADCRAAEVIRLLDKDPSFKTKSMEDFPDKEVAFSDERNEPSMKDLPEVA